MTQYEYKYVHKILNPSISKTPVIIYRSTPEAAEKALNDLGAKEWDFVGTTEKDGHT